MYMSCPYLNRLNNVFAFGNWILEDLAISESCEKSSHWDCLGHLKKKRLSGFLKSKLPTKVQKYAVTFLNQINNPINEWSKFYLTRPIFYKTMLTIINYIHSFNFVWIESHISLLAFPLILPGLFVMLTGLKLPGSSQFPFWKNGTILVLIQDLSYFSRF